jgi:hypothetical protein
MAKYCSSYLTGEFWLTVFICLVVVEVGGDPVNLGDSTAGCGGFRIRQRGLQDAGKL